MSETRPETTGQGTPRPVVIVHTACPACQSLERTMRGKNLCGLPVTVPEQSVPGTVVQRCVVCDDLEPVHRRYHRKGH